MCQRRNWRHADPYLSIVSVFISCSFFNGDFTFYFDSNHKASTILNSRSNSDFLNSRPNSDYHDSSKPDFLDSRPNSGHLGSRSNADFLNSRTNSDELGSS
jgi:hypothetical protein